MREIVFDTETTGLNWRTGDRLVNIAGVELIRKIPTGRFMAFYLNPDRESSEGAFNVHKLTTAFLSTQPRFKDVAMSFLDFIAGAQLVIHNEAFDMPFFQNELTLAGFQRVVNRSHCTLCQAKRKYGRPKGNKLDDLVRQFGLRDLRAETGAHGALVDSLLLVNVYRNLEGLGTLDFDLTPFQDHIHASRQDPQSPRLPTIPQADATNPPADVGAGSGGAGEAVLGSDRVPDAAEAGRAEPASATA